MHACTLGRLETAEVLLDRGADVNHIPKGRGPQVLQRSPSPRPQSRPSSPATKVKPLRRTPLIVAAAVGHAEMVRLLLERGADADLQDGEGRTAGDVAREEGFVDVLREIARVS